MLLYSYIVYKNFPDGIPVLGYIGRTLRFGHCPEKCVESKLNMLRKKKAKNFGTGQ